MTALPKRIAAEAVGTGLLLAVVVGSGIMGERLGGGNTAVALLANSIATGCGLAVLIVVFAPVSGAHFNPVVTLAAAVGRGLGWRDVAPYVAAQVIGAFAGVAIAHLMFEEPIFFASERIRTGIGQWSGEVVATFGLIVAILACGRHRAAATPAVVALYITGAYWFTSSTSFANPAVTLARAATDTFAGIRPADAPGFIVAQVAGAMLALAFMRWLFACGRDGNIGG